MDTFSRRFFMDTFLDYVSIMCPQSKNQHSFIISEIKKRTLRKYLKVLNSL